MPGDGTRGPLLARFSLRTKVTVLLLALSLGPLLLAGTVNVNRAVERGKLSERLRFAQGAIFAAHAFADLADRLRKDVQLLARRFPVETFDFQAEADRLADFPFPRPKVTGWRDASILAGLHQDYLLIFVALADGRVFYTHPFHNVRVPVDLDEMPWMTTLEEHGNVAMGALPPLTSRELAGLVSVAPLVTRDGRRMGWLGAVLDGAQLEAIVDRTLSTYGSSGVGSRLLLLTPDGRVAADSARKGLGKPAPPHLVELLFPGTSELHIPDGGWVVARAEVARTGWFVQLLTPIHSAYRHVYLMIWMLIAVTVLTFIFVLLFADYLASVLLRPIHELERGAQMVGAGALDYRIELAVHGDDELGRLAHAFNEMGENLLRSQKQVKAYSRNLETAHEELDAMVYAITHDLKKSLRGIEAFASFLEEDYAPSFDEDGVELLRSITSNVERINALADDLIRLVEQERERGEAMRFDMAALLSEARERALARHPGEVIVEPPMPEVMADRDRLLLVFDNLIDNGLKFNDNPTPRVTIRCGDDGLDWRFEVEDNGIGIEPQYHERVFELFARLNHHEAFRGSGTGLNLARRIVQDHRGTLSLRSQPGRGTTFVLTLPKDPALLTSPGLQTLS